MISLILSISLGLGFWLAFGYGFQQVAEKLGSQNGIWAYIPIMNVLLYLEIADLPTWYIVLLLVPVLNLAILVMIFWKISEACQKPGWYSLLIFIPFGNLALPFILLSD